MNTTRYLLIFMLLCTWALTVIGCKRSGGSLNKIGTPDTVSSDGLLDSDFKPNQDGYEDAGPLKVGDKAPDFEVEVMGGESLRLSNYFGGANGPTVLLFNRAHW